VGEQNERARGVQAFYKSRTNDSSGQSGQIRVTNSSKRRRLSRLGMGMEWVPPCLFPFPFPCLYPCLWNLRTNAFGTFGSLRNHAFVFATVTMVLSGVVSAFAFALAVLKYTKKMRDTYRYGTYITWKKTRTANLPVYARYIVDGDRHKFIQ
jgi:hypothetical protein